MLIMNFMILKKATTKKQIEQWLKQVDWQILLNMRGMTWRV